MSAFFVTSSGTEIGKTHITALMCQQLIHQGKSVLPLKPILSGFNESKLEDCDSGVLLSAIGGEVTADAVHEMTPWRFKEAISPDMAAAREGREIAFQPLIDFCKTGMESGADVVLIEGAGGVHAPINDERRMFDIPRALEIPAVLVVGSYLGTISHTITAYESLKRHGVEVIGIVISQSEASPVPLEETRGALRRFLGPIRIEIVPRVSLSDWNEAPDLTVFLG